MQQVNRRLPPPPQHPHFQPPPPPPRPGKPWRAVLVVAIICALTAAVTATVTVTAARDGSAPVAAAPAPQTVTVTPAPPPPPSAEAANRFTCQTGWQAVIGASDRSNEVLLVLGDLKLSDPAVQQDPALASAVRTSGSIYKTAGATLMTQIAPGTSPVLTEAARAAAAALKMEGHARTVFDPDPLVYRVVDAAGAVVDALCARLAPE